MTPTKGTLMVTMSSRHTFEKTARKLVQDNRKVEFKYGASVAGLLFEDVSVGADKKTDEKAAAAADSVDSTAQAKTVTGALVPQISVVCAVRRTVHVYHTDNARHMQKVLCQTVLCPASRVSPGATVKPGDQRCTSATA